MELSLYEQNVTPVKEKRNVLAVSLVKGVLSYNGEELASDKVDLVKELIENHKNEIIELNKEILRNSKGGRQETLNIRFDGDNTIYHVLGNATPIESSKLYDELKESILNIIEK